MNFLIAFAFVCASLGVCVAVASATRASWAAGGFVQLLMLFLGWWIFTDQTAKEAITTASTLTVTSWIVVLGVKFWIYTEEQKGCGRR